MLLSFGWWQKNWPKGRKKPAAGLFPEQLDGTIAQFQCGSESIGFGGGWEAPVKAKKPKTSLPLTFGQRIEGKEEPGPLIREEWQQWEAEVEPEMTGVGEVKAIAGPYGTLSMNAREPFLLSTYR